MHCPELDRQAMRHAGNWRFEQRVDYEHRFPDQFRSVASWLPG
jgi:hypothetical protein